MKSINLIPPKNPDRQLRPWIGLVLIMTLAAGALGGIYYYADSIRTQAEQYLTEASEVERQTVAFMEQAVQKVSSDRLNEFARQLEGIEAARIGWETHLADVTRQLPKSAVLSSVISEANRGIHVQATFKTYEDALQFVHRLEELEQASRVSVNSFTESVNEATDSIPVTDADGTVLYHETKKVQQPVYTVDVRIAMTEGEASDEQR